MKNLLFITVLSLCMSLNAQEKQMKINTSKSTIEWTGSQLFKFNKHSGTVKIKTGTIETKFLKVVGGDFIIDMNSIINTDGKYNSMLVDHLKSNDFFSVKQYPESKLKIANVFYKDEDTAEIYAELTIKNVTNLIKFKSTIKINNGSAILETKFFIDRTLWGINYESKGILGAVKDDIISDAIEFHVVIEWIQDMC